MYSPAGDTTCGSDATYSCNPGYELSTSGDVTRYCGEDSLWNGTAKNCSSKKSICFITLTMLLPSGVFLDLGGI